MSCPVSPKAPCEAPLCPGSVPGPTTTAPLAQEKAAQNPRTQGRSFNRCGVTALYTPFDFALEGDGLRRLCKPLPEKVMVHVAAVHKCNIRFCTAFLSKAWFMIKSKVLVGGEKVKLKFLLCLTAPAAISQLSRA